MARLENKVAIITGAAGGMGLSTAKLFFQEGAKVVMTDVQEDLLTKEANAISEGNNVLPIVLDVSSSENWKQVVEKTMETYGKIDILVNNAGIHIAKGILEADISDWDKVMSINTTGVFLGMKEVIPHMQNNGGGSIVNISSIGAFAGGDHSDAGGAAYSASKGAVRSLSKHVAKYFGKDNIRVNSIHPGPIYTPIMEKVGITIEASKETHKNVVVLPQIVGGPEDIGYGVLYLASDESKFVTGEELIIDGGIVATR
ncbi:short-chain dehydrogenase [Chryseobacterium sp. Leaf404]|uniref:SDR family NAD(P)-dependent oxidoreductase n=1 Tax=unclassified Chryseobacterium TaxID=2593645 RepID=UPI0006F531B8|nr:MULTISPECIES: glucose 1-dehydrogenase [unclassified Chryseobacterium]KQT20863.1 short-chain dehydrogenase [Chryseobacterium sp. Leaf404]